MNVGDQTNVAQPLTARLRKPCDKSCLHRLVPDGTCWHHVGFEVYRFQPGERLTLSNAGFECLAVVIEGAAGIALDGAAWAELPHRRNPFLDPPSGAYIPPGQTWTVEARGALELAICRATATESRVPRVIRPEDLTLEMEGTGDGVRHVRDLLPADRDLSERLFVAEVCTPRGPAAIRSPRARSRSPQRETRLEQSCYVRVDPPSGAVAQRIQLPDGQGEQSLLPQDRDLLTLPPDTHAVATNSDHDVYCLTVMAGPVPRWAARVGPDHAPASAASDLAAP